MDDEVRCRYCERLLKKTSGGVVLHPDTGDRLPMNFYGGPVCSKRCDIAACIALESSMPGAGIARRPGSFAQEQIDRNWPDDD